MSGRVVVGGVVITRKPMEGRLTQRVVEMLLLLRILAGLNSVNAFIRSQHSLLIHPIRRRVGLLLEISIITPECSVLFIYRRSMSMHSRFALFRFLPSSG